jgi:hypothetical protein
MSARRLTPRAACVLAMLPLLVLGCAGHTAPPTRSGSMPARSTPARTAATATPAMKSGIIPANARLLPNHLLIDTRLDEALSTVRPQGFAFSTKVADAVTAKDGSVAIPAGTRIRGVVIGVRPATGTNPPLICLNLDFLMLNGREYSIRSSIKSALVDNRAMTLLPRDSIMKLFPNEPAVALHGTIVQLPAPNEATEPALLPAGTSFVIELDSAIAVQR